LNILLFFSGGNYVYNGSKSGLRDMRSWNNMKDMLTRWQKPGDITNVPRMDNAQTSNFGAQSSRWLTDARYLNIQNITFAYDFKGKIGNRTLPFSNARFYVSMENVKMFTKRSGMNPMQSFTGVTSIGYIPARVVNFGVNVNL